MTTRTRRRLRPRKGAPVDATVAGQIGLPEPVDLHAELARLWPIACRFAARDDVSPGRLPTLRVRHHGVAYCTGAAWEADHEILISLGTCCSVAHVYETLAHEVAHLIADPKERRGQRRAVHSPSYWCLLRLLVEHAYETGPVDLRGLSLEDRDFALERAIFAARKRKGLSP